jgi:hypothetical protein
VPPLSDDPLISARTVDPPAGAPRTRRERRQAERRARRQERYTKVRELQAQAVSIHELARQMGISRQTVRRFLRVDQFPEHSQRRPRRNLDPFLPYLREQLAEGNDKGAALWRMRRDRHGYSGSRSQVTLWVAPSPSLPVVSDGEPKVSRR